MPGRPVGVGRVRVCVLPFPSLKVNTIVPPSPALTIGTGLSGLGVPSCVLLPYTVRPHRGAEKASSTLSGLPVSVPIRMFCRALTALIASPAAFASAASLSWVRVVSSATAGPVSPLGPCGPVSPFSPCGPVLPVAPVGALRALLTLRADRANGASVALVTFLAFEIAACDAVLQLLQTVGGFLSALVCVARTVSGLLCCGLCIGLGLLCGGGIGVHGIHQLLPCRGARFRHGAVLCAGVGTDTIPQVCAGDGLSAVAALKGDAPAPGLCGHAGGHGHIAVHHKRGGRVFAVRDVPKRPNGQPCPLAGCIDVQAVHTPVLGVAKAHQLLIARHFDDAIGCERYALLDHKLLLVDGRLLVCQRLFHHADSLFNHTVQHFIGDERLQPVRQCAAQRCKNLSLFLCALTAAHDAVLGDGHELQCPLLDVLLVAQPDGTNGQRGKADEHQYQCDGCGDKVKHCFHDLLLLSAGSC
nr:MAG TPA: hypothetical protein [Caudoviricetes sp.]